MTIGALAARTGVGAETIRYYERVGVLPVPTRGGSAQAHAGYRRYDSAAAERLAFVRRARDLGFSLDEVRELLSLADEPDRPCGEVDALARTHLERVEARIAQLESLRAELGRIIGACRGGHAVADCRILQALGRHPS
ncbi:MAG: helix-turn-helix domain-containing protein [Gemmatimonadaceae bacterium]|nr:helix-turn-helix domain-containing protein [Gemmatimonadaceae bacterium]